MKVLFSLITLLSVLHPLTPVWAGRFNPDKQCRAATTTRMTTDKQDAGCLITIRGKLLVVHDGINLSLPGGKVGKRDDQQEESAEQAACRNTFEKIIGIQLTKTNTMTVGEPFYKDDRLTVFKCTLDENTQTTIDNNVPYKVIDADLKRNGIYEISLTDPVKDSRLQVNYPDLMKKITGGLGE